MGTKSQFFRAFVAGQTISDGRQITPEMIDDIASTFNPDTYTPRVNVEHISGYSPEPPFNGYGDVCAVRAQDDDITVNGVTGKRRALYCQVDGNDQLVQLAGRDQKPFPSVEITGNYAGTNKTGLVGLAFTDTPASIGTQRLKFSRALGTDVFTAADRADLKFETTISAEDTFLAKLKAAFGFTGTPAAPVAPAPAAPPAPPAPIGLPAPANDNAMREFARSIADTVSAAVAPIAEAQARFATDFASLKSKVETTAAPGTFHRPPATGGNGATVTDC